MWGLFGPIQFTTKRGNKVTFFGGFVTLPLTVYSLYKLKEALHGSEEPSGSGLKGIQEDSTIDLSNK